jgi:hypothetical protein
MAIVGGPWRFQYVCGMVKVVWFSYMPFEPDENVVDCWKQVAAKYHNTMPKSFCPNNSLAVG